MTTTEKESPQSPKKGTPEASDEAGNVDMQPRIYAKRDEDAWFLSLSTLGSEGLLIADVHIFQRQSEEDRYTALSMKHWTPINGSSVPLFGDVVPEMGSSSSPAKYALKNPLPSTSVLAEVMDNVTNLLQKQEGKVLSRTMPLLFVSSNGGYSRHYSMDKDPPLYKCFIFLGSEVQDEYKEPEDIGDSIAIENSDADISVTSERAFVASADPEAVKTFGDTTVLTMTALYAEGHRKFRMHVGDIVLLPGGSPFLVDIPASIRRSTQRLLSWNVYTSEDGKQESLQPTPAYCILSIEELVARNKDAKAFYDSEMSEITKDSKSSKDIGDSSLYMERLRVTPGVYDCDEVREAVISNQGFHNVCQWLRK